MLLASTSFVSKGQGLQPSGAPLGVVGDSVDFHPFVSSQSNTAWDHSCSPQTSLISCDYYSTSHWHKWPRLTPGGAAATPVPVVIDSMAGGAVFMGTKLGA